MNVFFSALELSPYTDQSGVGSSVAALGRALSNLDASVTIALPLSPEFQEAGLLLARRLSPLDLGAGGSEATAHAYDVQLPSGIELVLVDVGGPISGDAALLDRATAERTGRFARAVAVLVEDRISIGRPPDVVHAHDALAGLCLAALSERRVRGVARVLGIHDARRTGSGPAELAEALGLSPALVAAHGFVSGSELSVLDGVLTMADRVYCSSPSYARELSAPERSGRLAAAFGAAEIAAITEGVDVSVYNPATDPALPVRYDAAAPQAKGNVKTAIVRQYGLVLDPARPLVVLDSFASGKEHLSAFVSALSECVDAGLSLVVSGFGAPSAEAKKVLSHLGDRALWLAEPSAPERRRLLAAADFQLSLRATDPSGAALGMGARYGAIPVALAVDAALDLIVDCDAELVTGTGFLFDSADARSLSGVAGRLMAAYRRPAFAALVRRVMRQDLSWDRAARRYLLSYRELCGPRSRGSHAPLALGVV